MCHFRTCPPSLDHLVSQLLKLHGHLEPERLGCPEVDDHLELRWMLYRQIGRLGPSENLVDVDGPLPKLVGGVKSVGDQPPFLSVISERINCGQPIAFCQPDNKTAVCKGNKIR